MIKVPTMRKRILALTVILLILLVLCGCSSQGKDQRLPFGFCFSPNLSWAKWKEIFREKRSAFIWNPWIFLKRQCRTVSPQAKYGLI